MHLQIHEERSANEDARKLTMSRINSESKMRRMRKPVERMRIAVSWIGIVSIIVVALTTDSVWKSSELAEELFYSLSLALATVGCLGRVWCLVYIAGRKNKELVICGPYSLCRNPLYLFSGIGAIGVSIATCTFTIPLAVLMGFVGLYPTVVRAEETRLARVHGAAYENYRRKTPQFVPSFNHYRPINRLPLDVHHFQLGLMDAAWFLIAVMGTHLITHMHEAGFGLVLVKLL